MFIEAAIKRNLENWVPGECHEKNQNNNDDGMKSAR